MTRAAVAGLGLIGGSLALALEARGYDGNPSVRDSARRRGIDVADSLADAIAGAEVVVAAVPTEATMSLLVQIARLAPDAIVTDTASLKLPIVEAALELPAGARFVGGHPMAGSHETGVEAASADLFRGRPWILCRTARSDDASLAAVTELVRAAGGRPVLLDAERHDRLMTWASHLPLAVASALARSVGRPEPARSSRAWRGRDCWTPRASRASPRRWRSSWRSRIRRRSPTPSRPCGPSSRRCPRPCGLGTPPRSGPSSKKPPPCAAP